MIVIGYELVICCIILLHIATFKEFFVCKSNNKTGDFGHYKIFCVNVKYGIQYGFRIFYLIALQNEENYEREESCSA